MEAENPSSPSTQDQQTIYNSVNSPLRIAHVTTSLIGGGAAKAMMDLVSTQRAAGHEVLVVSIAPPTAPPAWFSIEHGEWNEIRHLDWILRYDHPLNLKGGRQRLRNVLDEFHPDIVHSNLWAADILASLAVNRYSCVHIAHIQNQEVWKNSTHWKHRFRRSITRMLFRRSMTRFIACSEAVKAYETLHMQWPKEDIDVAYNTADSRRFRPREKRQSGRLRIGSAGWFIERKGHTQLINAVATLVSEGLDLELVLAGEGPLRGEYLRLATDRGITDRLILPGPVSDMVSFYQSLDVFALSSSEEGLALVVLEAMASGLCIVASALDGMDEAVHPEINGLLYNVGDQLSLVSALRRALIDQEFNSRMGLASRRIAVENFSLSESALKVDSIYRRRLMERQK